MYKSNLVNRYNAYVLQRKDKSIKKNRTTNKIDMRYWLAKPAI